MDLYHLRQGLHVIASSWDYHGGAESRVSVRGNSGCFKTYDGHGMLMESMGVADIIRPKNTVAYLNHQSIINMKTIN
jgi:hypothetical protein